MITWDIIKSVSTVIGSFVLGVIIGGGFILLIHALIVFLKRFQWFVSFVDLFHIRGVKKTIKEADYRAINDMIRFIETVPDGYRKRIIVKALKERKKEIELTGFKNILNTLNKL